MDKLIAYFPNTQQEEESKTTGPSPAQPVENILVSRVQNERKAGLGNANILTAKQKRLAKLAEREFKDFLNTDKENIDPTSLRKPSYN